MNKQEAINKLDKLIQRAIPLKSKEKFSDDFTKWRRDCSITLGYIFGNESNHKKSFDNVHYSLGIFLSDTPDSEFQNAYEAGVNKAIILLQSMKSEVMEFWSDNPNNQSSKDNSFKNIELVINRFHQVARQLKIRHSERSTIKIEDEYDVQDLFHALLKLYFDDVREEEWTPSYAGASSRTDFLLKNEKIIIEIKKTRKTLKAKEIGEQLIIDSVRYKSHPDCRMLICFVYDPDEFINNPKGLENDLTKEFDGVPVYTYIRPE